MKRSTPFRFLSSIVLALLVALAPAPVLALGDELPTPQLSGVFVTELQTGLGAGQTDKEYIELYNATEQEITLGGWQLWYMPESRIAIEPYRAITIADGVVLAPGTHLLFASNGYAPNQATPTQTFEKMLSAEGGNVVLLAPTALSCQLAAQDAVAWGGATLGAGDPIVSSPKTKDKLLARTVGSQGYRNTRNNLHDFASSSFSGATSTTPYLGTPGMVNTQPAGVPDATPVTTGIDFTEPVTDPNCEPDEEEPSQQPPQTIPPTNEPPATIIPATSDEPGRTGTVFPERSKGLVSPHLTELLPNPASPQTDAADEFIELYNSNDAVFELTGFKLVAGKRSYTFPAGTLIEPKSFVAYFSADTRLALSNSGGRAQLLDPFGNIIAQTEPYGTAKDGQAWALANGTWHWTTTPTPKAANAIQAPTAAKKKSAASKTSSTNQAVKGATTTAASDQPAAEAASLTSNTPIHPLMLALVGVFAILYGIYEYRGDLANKFYQFRAYRAARRSLREAPERRGGG